jgi:cytoskeletal protein CcmA (bactofilin family)
MFSKGKREPVRAATSSAAEAPQRPRGNAVPSIVSPDMTITGNVNSQGDVQIDGKVDGDVAAETLTIGEGGTINGTVRARTLRVLGVVTGEIQAEDVTLMASARVQGDVIHASLAIEAGAHIEGHCRRHDAPLSGDQPVAAQPVAIGQHTGEELAGYEESLDAAPNGRGAALGA